MLSTELVLTDTLWLWGLFSGAQCPTGTAVASVGLCPCAPSPEHRDGAGGLTFAVLPLQSPVWQGREMLPAASAP